MFQGLQTILKRTIAVELLLLLKFWRYLLLNVRAFSSKVSMSVSSTIEQNLPQPYLKVLFGLSGRSGGQRGAALSCKGVETQEMVRLGLVGFFNLQWS